MIISAIIGIVFGYISSQTFFAHSYLALIPWGLVGVGVGFIAKDKGRRLWSGAFYGFFLSLVFLIGGFHGKSSSIPGFTILTSIITVIGAVCGTCLAYISILIRKS